MWMRRAARCVSATVLVLATQHSSVGMVCSKCGESGHNAATCGRSEAPRKQVKGGGRHCSNCGRTGHDKRNCPEGAPTEPASPSPPTVHGPSPGSGRKCSICGQAGHDKRKCPSVKQSAANQQPAAAEAEASTDAITVLATPSRVKIASWNLQHLSDATWEKKNQAGFLERVLGGFDLIAVQEITNASQTLDYLCERLEGDWDYMISPKVRKKNGRLDPECAAFLWRSDRIVCTLEAPGGGPSGHLIMEGDTHTPAVSYFHRPPFWSAFRAGDLDFVLLNTHITFDGPPLVEEHGEAARLLEVENIVAAVTLLRQGIAQSNLPHAPVLVAGDFNLDVTNSKLCGLFGLVEMHAALSAKQSGKRGGTLVKSNHSYDNIWIPGGFQVTVIQADVIDLGSIQQLDTNGDGVIDTADVVISDHNPLWLELNVCDSTGSDVVETKLDPAIELSPIRISTIVTDGEAGKRKVGRRYTTR